MSVQAAPEKPERKRRFPVRWLVLVVLVALIVAFGAINAGSVQVKPFGYAPMYQVLAIPFVVGVIVGWILRSRISIRVRGVGGSREAEKDA